MNDYAVGTDQNDAAPPGPFETGATVRMHYQVLDKSNGADEVPINLTDPRWEVRVRCWRRGATTLLRDELCPPSEDAGEEGFFDHGFACGSVAYESALEWRLVLIDKDESDPASKSGYDEHRLLAFRAAIPAAPRTGP